MSWITTSDEKGGMLAARYLLEQGCKNILHITYSLKMLCAKDRYSGFIQEIKKANQKDSGLLVLEYTPLRVGLGEYLKENKVDGIFAFNDMLAYETLNILEKEDIKDVKIVGFDNIQEMFHFPIKIVTIGGDKKEMAKTAVETLLGRIEKKEDVVHHHIFDVFLSEE